MTYDEALMRQVTIPFPRRTDGTGVCFLHMRKGSAEHFGLDKLPTPDEYGSLDPGGQFRTIRLVSKRGGANNLSLRIAYEWPAGAEKPHMTRLRISGDPCLDTVQVLTDHLNETGVKWLWFCKAHGGMLSSSCFRSTV